jgi:hypothetical protein
MTQVSAIKEVRAAEYFANQFDSWQSGKVLIFATVISDVL